MICIKYHTYIWLKGHSLSYGKQARRHSCPGAEGVRSPFPARRSQTGQRNLRPCAIRSRTLQWRKGAFTMAFRLQFRRSTTLAAALAPFAAMALTGSATPARADRCDDLAGQLKGQIDGLAVGKTAANLIYLSHPKAKEITLG